MSAEEVALEHYRGRRELVDDIAGEALRLWRLVSRSDLVGSWREAAAQLLVSVSGAQLLAAKEADSYLDDVLGEQDIDPAGNGKLIPRSLAGIASDGRTLDTLLEQPIIATLTAIGGGAPVDTALATGYSSLDMIVRTQVADAGRVADQVALTARPEAGGYTRMVVGRTCSRCIILGGRFYRWNAGFKRHPRCFPAGVVVDGPASEAATRRFYQGELVILATASGQKLPLTGNHPVLTRRGWVPARLLQEGDEVVRRTRAEGATALVVPDHDQVPARIEDVWGALGVPLLDAMESSPEDFHGDGQHGKVDVVWADRTLDDRILAALPQHLAQLDLARTAGSALALDRQRAAELLDLTDSAHPGRPVGVDNLGLALFGSLLRGANGARLTHAATLHSGLGQDAGDRASRDAVLLGQSEFACSREVRGHDGFGGQVENLTRWDAPVTAFSMETRGGYAARGLDLLQRLAGQVEFDRLVEVRRVDWSGHVYSLTSSEGWHSANSLIVSNCDCVHIPSREAIAGDVQLDPRKTFESMSRADQDKAFTIAGAQAIRDGADPAKVVNARRGMYAAGDKLFTREAAGRRPRLMPQQILREAKDRDDAIRLLRLHGYLLR